MHICTHFHIHIHNTCTMHTHTYTQVYIHEHTCPCAHNTHTQHMYSDGADIYTLSGLSEQNDSLWLFRACNKSTHSSWKNVLLKDWMRLYHIAYHFVFKHSPVTEHLSWFHPKTLLNIDVATWEFMHFCEVFILIHLGMLRSRFTGSHNRSIFNLLTKLYITVYHNDFYSGYNFFIIPDRILSFTLKSYFQRQFLRINVSYSPENYLLRLHFRF